MGIAPPPNILEIAEHVESVGWLQASAELLLVSVIMLATVLIVCKIKTLIKRGRHEKTR